MTDQNKEVRKICERGLVLIAESSAKWQERIKNERFCWNNAQWLEAIAKTNNLLSSPGIMRILHTLRKCYIIIISIIKQKNCFPLFLIRWRRPEWYRKCFRSVVRASRRPFGSCKQFSFEFRFTRVTYRITHRIHRRRLGKPLLINSLDA